VAVSRLATRLDRLEALAFERDAARVVDRQIAAGELQAWERADALEGARRFYMRVNRHQAAGLGLVDAMAAVMREEGLTDEQIEAALPKVEV
jgi:hypothetical protein